MYTTVQRWGNSCGLRIPKALLDGIDIRENDRVELFQEGNVIRIQKAAAAQHRTVEDRLVAFYRKPIGEIEPIQSDGEFDWGARKGSEIW